MAQVVKVPFHLGYIWSNVRFLQRKKSLFSLDYKGLLRKKSWRKNLDGKETSTKNISK